MRFPRTSDEALAQQLGITVAAARNYRTGATDTSGADLYDARVGALVAQSEIDVLADMDVADIEDIAEADDPETAMAEMVDRRTDWHIRAKIGAYASWANTEDRSARTAPARRAGPSNIDYWLKRVDASVENPKRRRQMAESMKKEYYTRLAYKSAKARREKARQ